ncbi:MAG: GAF domain-containing protein [Anaerolineales bacterium]
MKGDLFPSPLRFRGSLVRSLTRTLIALTFIPLTLLGSASYFRARSLLRDQVVAQMENSVQIQAEEAQKLAQIRLIRLDRLVIRPDTHELYERAFHINLQSPDYATVRQQLLEAYQAINREGEGRLFHQFFLLDPQGEIPLASEPRWKGLKVEEPFASFLLKQHRATFALFDVRPLYEGQFAFYTIVQVRTANESLLGVLVGVSEAPVAAAFINSIERLNPQAHAYLINHDGLFLRVDPYTLAIAPFEPFTEQKERILPLLRRWQEQKEGESWTIEYELAEGTPAIAHLRWLPELHTIAVLEVPQSAVFGKINSLVPFVIFLLASVALLMGAVIWGTTRRFIQPLLSLADTTRRFAEGDFRERSPIQRKDEIGLLAASFNRMADELSALYRRLELQVDERTRQVRIAAEVAQSLTTARNLEELLRKTTQLIVERFDYYHAGIFLLDASGRYALLRAAHSPAAEALLQRGHRLEVGSNSIVGWVAANNRPRVVSDVSADPLHLKNELLPQTRAEAAVPIASGDLVLGVLDVQSKHPEAFDEGTLITLQTLANQIAVAIQNVGILESAQVSFDELQRLYRASRQIVTAATPQQALENVFQALRQSPYGLLVFTAEGENLRPILAHIPSQEDLPLPEFSLSSHEILHLLKQEPYLVEGEEISSLPSALGRWVGKYRPAQVGVLSLRAQDKVQMLFVFFAIPPQALPLPSLQPYMTLIDLLGVTLEKLQSAAEIERRLKEQEALANFSQALATANDMQTICTRLHEQVKNVIGDYSFFVALYDAKTNSIEIPYRYSEGEVISIEPFPLGESLTSIVIHTKQPLLLVEDTERRAAMLGAKVAGKPAKSWLGVPIVVQGEAIGALIIQDTEREHQFTEDHVRFLSALTAQVGGLIHNIRLLEEARQHALQVEAAAEIARDISAALNLDELLQKAVSLIRERFSFYHAAVFLIDAAREYAVIREATGEAGAQMKRQGHKLAVGSKSIVGYVSSRGEPLVVNDTSRDATYYPNPLLPNTRAEAAIPIRVGERILGVLDVQSTEPYTFDEDILRTLRILADQLAIALLNAELFATTQEHLAQHRLLHHITSTAAAGSTLEEALQNAVQGLQVTLGGDRVSILLTDKNKEFLEVKAFSGYSDEARGIRIPIGSGITGWVAQHHRPLRIGDVTADPRYIQVSPETRSEIAIPLIYRGEVLGVLNAESERINAYSESDEEMLSTLAGSLAAIIANARLLEQLRRRVERERLLFEITDKIRRSSDMQTILMTTAGELLRILGAQHATVELALPTEQSPKDGGEKSP